MSIFVTMLRLLLYPCFKWVYKSDFNRYEELGAYQRKAISDYRDEVFNLNKELDRYKNLEDNIKDIVKSNAINYIDVSDKDEIVIISHNSSDIRNSNIFINNLHTRYSFGCCHLSSDPREAFHLLALLEKVNINDIEPQLMLAICDIISKDKNYGYGSALLSYCCKIAQRQGLKYAVGWLSSVDKENHPQLERFYKRLGFEVHYFPEGNEGVVIKYL